MAARCYFDGGGAANPDPADLSFARVPMIGENVVHEDHDYRVTRVTWTTDGPMLHLSLIA